MLCFRYLLIFFVFAGLASSCIASKSVQTINYITDEKQDIRCTVHKPSGEGPYPAVIILHGCGGVCTHTKRWAYRLRDWGYISVIVDSHTTRGIENNCGGKEILRVQPAIDAYHAMQSIRSLEYVDAKRIGVIGFSQGGNAVLELVGERFVSERRQMPYLKAAVAYYPYCRRPVDLTTNVYVFIGEKDDWTPAHMCDRYIPGFEKNGHALHYTKYPHAFHSFDAKRDRAIQYLGHRLAYDREAASDSFSKVRAFLARHVRE